MFDRLAEAVTGAGRRKVIVAVLLVTLVLGAGAPSVELSTSLDEFRGGTAESDATDYVEANLSGGESNVTQSLVVVRNTLPESAPRRERSVLTREAYLNYVEAQRALENNETVARTLHPEQRPLSIATIVGIVAIERERGTDVDDIRVDPRPPIDEQIAAIEGLNDFEREPFTSYAVGTVLSDVSHTWPDGGGFAFAPTSYEANQKTATAIVVSHRDETDPKNLTAAQTAAEEVVEAVGIVATFAVSWILGTMYLLGIPFNVMTALITSFTVGFGVDYSIHVAERYVQELDGGASMSDAIETAVLGTGGALLGSAVTDIVGVGVLAFAILEPLQQFGTITAITIAYSFLASVVVLPSLLVVWTRGYGPSGVGVDSGSRVREREPMSVDD